MKCSTWHTEASAPHFTEVLINSNTLMGVSALSVHCVLSAWQFYILSRKGTFRKPVELYWLKEGFLPTESSYCFFCNSSRLCYNRHSHQSPPGQLLGPTSQSLQLPDSNCSQDPVRLKQSHCCRTNSQPHTPRLHKCCPPAVPADTVQQWLCSSPAAVPA